MTTETLHGPDDAIIGHSVVPHEAWITARKELLKREKELTRLSDEVSAARRALPWEKVEKNYVFNGPDGEVTLAGLFGTKRQLIIHHLMFAPGWTEACIGCSHSADHADSARQHFENADVSYVAISRASLADLETFRKRMGWTFDWVSSGDTDFNFDYGVSFTPEQVASGNVGYNYGTSSYAYDELPGVSVFYKDGQGNIFHTYSTYARGLDILLGSHNYLDLTPKGRAAKATPADPGWLRYHDQYQTGEPESCCSCK
ncbi:MAG: thioredoxin family protein [Luteolibacter sp.]